MKLSLILVIASPLILAFSPTGIRPSQTYQVQYENVLGTSLELKITAASEDLAATVEQASLEEIDRLEAILSTYQPTSEISRWQSTLHTDILVSPELFEVLSLFDDWQVKTGGALNASAAVASSLWKRATVDQTLPGAAELASAVAAMNRPHWELNKEKRTARHLSTEPLVLNSFVKSYIISKVSKVIMTTPGVSGLTINIGGDIVVAGNRKEQILISDPLADSENDEPVSTLNISNKAIATSGNYRRGFQIGDQWFSHILDVRTAIPAKEIISATVVAERATDAGALATAFNILSPEESDALARQIPGAEYLIITKTGQHIQSNGWAALQESIPKDAPNGSVHLGDNGNFELVIEIELARFEGRFRRPFVAVWVEDKKKNPVRNLALWYNKSRWLPDLKRWYSRNQSFNQEPGNQESISSSSATRSPGQYTLKWDGTDDQGKPVPAGKYTVYIEAAREHGTYQLIRQEVEWNGKPKQLKMPGGIEITSSSLDYHKVGGK